MMVRSRTRRADKQEQVRVHASRFLTPGWVHVELRGFNVKLCVQADAASSVYGSVVHEFIQHPEWPSPGSWRVRTNGHVTLGIFRLSNRQGEPVALPAEMLDEVRLEILGAVQRDVQRRLIHGLLQYQPDWDVDSRNINKRPHRMVFVPHRQVFVLHEVCHKWREQLRRSLMNRSGMTVSLDDRSLIHFSIQGETTTSEIVGFPPPPTPPAAPPAARPLQLRVPPPPLTPPPQPMLHRVAAAEDLVALRPPKPTRPTPPLGLEPLVKAAPPAKAPPPRVPLPLPRFLKAPLKTPMYKAPPSCAVPLTRLLKTLRIGSF